MTQGARITGTILLCIIFVALFALGIYEGLTRHTVGANDFYSRWMGAQALFLRGENPYSEAVTREIQMAMYGRLARPDEDQVAFAYPMYAAFVVAPLVALPYAQAQAIWMAILICAVGVSAIVLIWVNRVVLNPITIAAVLLGALVFYPSLRGIFLGQYALVSFLCLALALWAIQTHSDIAAGALLALATIKPQMAVFIVPLLVLWAIREKRRRLVIGALGTLVGLIALAMLWLPSWPSDFVRAVFAYAEYARVGPPLQTTLRMFLPSGIADPVALLLGSMLLVATLIEWTRARDACMPALDLAAIATTCIAVRIGSPDQVLLLFPWLRWLFMLRERRRAAMAILLALVVIVLPWLVFFATLRGNKEDPVTTTVLPLGTLVAYGIGRLIIRVSSGQLVAK